MTREQNIKAILECYFAGFKEDIIDSACKRILEIDLKPGRFCPTCGAKMGEQNEMQRIKSYII